MRTNRPIVALLSIALLAILAPQAASAGPDQTIDQEIGVQSGIQADIQADIQAAFALQAQDATLEDVRDALTKLDPTPEDAPAVAFAIAGVDFLRSAERLLQQAHRFGFLAPLNSVRGFAREQTNIFTWIESFQPEQMHHADFRTAIEQWVSDLEKAEAKLAAIDADFKCPIDIPAIRFDINRDGKASQRESLGALFDLLPRRWVWDEATRQSTPVPLVPRDLTVAFDRGDASWLRGYCHLMMALGSWVLAHDTENVWDHGAHIFFPKAQIKHDFLPNSTWSIERLFGGTPSPTPFDVTDVLAFIGNMQMPVSEPERMLRVLEHLRAAVSASKEMWTHYDDERDNDREWIPNPRQVATFEVVVDQEIRDAWLIFLNEADDVLHERKVLRFWRGDGTRGINLVKVFEEPTDFNLLYWIQGAAAAPYLEEGEFTAPETWARLVEVMDSRVFRHVFWFN